MISPQVSMVLNIIIAVLGGITSATAAFTTLFGQQEAQVIVTTAGLCLSMLAAINGALHSVSSPQPGPLASTPPAPPQGS